MEEIGSGLATQHFKVQNSRCGGKSSEVTRTSACPLVDDKGKTLNATLVEVNHPTFKVVR
jgi:hypothetical protein